MRHLAEDSLHDLVEGRNVTRFDAGSNLQGRIAVIGKKGKQFSIGDVDGLDVRHVVLGRR